ncbi:MAG: hypothetical protein KDA60_22380 [Planctomycetales bacterium]|nr:hypothetical protein [Planctomycetales bacterium]
MIRQQQPALVYVVDGNPADYACLLDEETRLTSRIVFLRTGREALRTNPDDSAAMWFVNMQLSDMSGTDLQALLRARGCQAPISLVGDAYRVEDEIEARCSGAAMYFAKPLASAAILAGC